MKKQLFSLLFILALFSAKAQWVNIPDTNFGKWLTTQYPTCMQGYPQIGFQMDTTCGAIVSEDSVNCSYSNIASLDGIQYFDSLVQLDCSHNLLTNLPTLPNFILVLSSGFNQLTSLPILPSPLKYLDCYHNLLTNLPTLPDSILNLNCGNNQLTSLPALPNTLIDFVCWDNHLVTLPNLPNSIGYIDCSFNQLTTLPTLPDSLKYFYCNNNQLNVMPELPNHLIELWCFFNQLSHLPEIANNLTHLSCEANKLNCLPKLPLSLNSLYFSGNNISCIPNRVVIQNFDIDPATLPLCDPASGCDFFYNISGNTHQKNQSYCIDDSIMPGAGLHNLKIKLKDNNQQTLQQLYTDNFGQYSFDIDSLVSYSVEVDTAILPFNVECPSTFFQSVNLSPIDSLLFDKNFGLACKSGSDFAIQNIYSSRFRPATNTVVYPIAGNLTKLRYNANCGNNSSGTVTTTFSGAVQYVSPAPNALTPTVSGNTLTYTIANLDSLKAGDLDFILQTDSFATIGSQVCITSVIHSDSIDANPSNDSLTMCFNVVNSYDPNKKTVYPKTITSDGDWLTYTIQFQNTGNDTAYTVVVKDTLPQDLVAESFQYLASSHKNIIQIKGQEVVFTFPRINLVDSSTNEPLSHGWVQFKIKTKNNLPPTFNIANRAAIFFDFNSPIFTNYAVTTQPTGIQNLKNEIAFSVFPNPFTQQFTILTNEKEKVSATIMDMMGKTIATKDFQQQTIIDLSAVAKGIYLVQLTNSKGEKGVYKLVKE